MFGASVYADVGEKLNKGQVVEVAIGGKKTAAIIRSERPSDDDEPDQRRYGIEFIKPTDAFLGEVRAITQNYRRDQGEDVTSEQLWLRSG